MRIWLNPDTYAENGKIYSVKSDGMSKYLCPDTAVMRLIYGDDVSRELERKKNE